jgi:hypothetical protein
MCCGQKRNNYVQQNHTAQQPIVNSDIPRKMWPDVTFEYTGETGLTVIGSITRQRYRFNGKGDRQIVDYRDASSIMAVPSLQKVKA